MRTMPRISVIIPTYNRIELLPRAIESAQSAGTEVEVVVVDDASTDGTANFCLNRTDIIYVRNAKNLRTAATRNVGLKVSSGEYIAFLDDDDLRLPGSLDKQASILDRDPSCGIVYGQFLAADQSGKILDEQPQPIEFIEGDIFWDLIESNRFGCLTTLTRRSAIDIVGNFDESSWMLVEDYDLWIRLAEKYAVRALREPVGIYRRPSADSGQWSSDPVKQLYRVANAFDSKWIHLDRVKNELDGDLNHYRLRILHSIADRIMFESYWSNRGLISRMRDFLYVLRIFPQVSLEVGFYRSLLRGLFRVT